MENIEIARESALKVLNFLEPKAEIFVELKDGRLRLNAEVAEAGFLIGHDGENLKALQHILGLMISKKIGQSLNSFNFVFDINNYQKEKEDCLMALAKNTAYRVLETKKNIELNPMSAAERKIVHLTIEKIEGVKSESLGEGEERRVMITPKNA